MTTAYKTRKKSNTRKVRQGLTSANDNVSAFVTDSRVRRKMKDARRYGQYLQQMKEIKENEVDVDLEEGTATITPEQ